MIRKIYLFSIVSFLLIGCYKNEYGNRRVNSNRFTIKPNNNADFIKIIDTSVFYQTVHSDEAILKYKLQNYITGLKFYNNGRVAFFKDVNFNKVELFNPKKATMGYYNFNDKGFFIESFYRVPGGTYKLSSEKILQNESLGDTIIIKTFKSATSSDRTTKYVKKVIPKEFLIYKPDW